MTGLIATETLPTPVALTARRLNIYGLEPGSDTFNYISYLLECSIKLIAVAVHGAIEESGQNSGYPYVYSLVRADGLGDWARVIREMSAFPSHELRGSFLPFMGWLSKKRGQGADEWFDEARDLIDTILDALQQNTPWTTKPTVVDLLDCLVVIRNKTRGHGAHGVDKYHEINQSYLRAASLFINNCLLFQSKWFYAGRAISKASRKPRLHQLTGETPVPLDAGPECNQPGLQILPADSDERLLYIGELVQVDSEFRHFYLPNGGFNKKTGKCEALDYSTGVSREVSYSEYLDLPVRLPPSETEGLGQLDIYANSLGNLPSQVSDYVLRPQLEKELLKRLCDRNHHIITLHGPGGIGKTTLAIQCALQLSSSLEPVFDSIVWFSARDVDLQVTGPKRVQPSVQSIDSIAKKFCSLFELKGDSVANFVNALEQPDTVTMTGKGNLFIFDNFETIIDSEQLHRFLDEHAHLPNKILITSRERTFKADFPIEVSGMEKPEAVMLMQQTSRVLHCEGLVDRKALDKIYDFSKGHPYVMRILIGEIAREGKYVSPQLMLPKRDDILKAVFERSFQKLSPGGRIAFLAIATLNYIVPEVALQAVFLSRDILDPEDALEECAKLSLVSLQILGADCKFYSAPELAKVFAKKKLDAAPDQFSVREIVEDIHKFGVYKSETVPNDFAPIEVAEAYSRWARANIPKHKTDMILEADRLLACTAEYEPLAWVTLAEFRKVLYASESKEEAIDDAYRRAYEADPSNGTVAMKRAMNAYYTSGDILKTLTFLINAIKASPDKPAISSEAAVIALKHVKDSNIRFDKRHIYIREIRQAMTLQASQDLLSAQQLSRLAWLILNDETCGEGPTRETLASKYVEKGLQLEPDNRECNSLLKRFYDKKDS